MWRSILPEKAEFDSQPLRINGRPAALQKGGTNEYFVPLLAANADTPFVIELRYTLPGDGRRLVLPTFPKQPAVVKEYLAVYLPETRTLLATRGPWNEEFCWRPTWSLRWAAVPTDKTGRISRNGSCRRGLVGRFGRTIFRPTGGCISIPRFARPRERRERWR